jgi:hypothetical protein
MKIEASGAGAKDSGFPKVLGRGTLSADAGFYQALFETPFLEPYLLAFAESLVREEELGADEVTDFLALGFSSIDSVGHDFLHFLDRTIGLERVAVLLSADHGVAPLPEYQARHGLPGGRVPRSDLACVARAGKPDWFLAPLHFDDKVLAKEKVKRQAAETLVAEQISACPSVARVWTRTEIENPKPIVDPVLLQFARSFYPQHSPDLPICSCSSRRASSTIQLALPMAQPTSTTTTCRESSRGPASGRGASMSPSRPWTSR